MPKRGIPAAALCLVLLEWTQGCFAPTAFGEATVLDPAQVAEKFLQRSWQKKDGLPDNQVQALLQTRDGYLWIGTRRGLARFDGLKFIVFDHLNTPEMPDDNCRSLAEDTEGNVWIATDDGLLRWHEGTFKRFTMKDGIAQDYIELVYADRRGRVWIGCGGLFLFRNEMFRRFDREQGIHGRGAGALHEDSTGVLWAIAGALRRFNEQTEKFEKEQEPEYVWLRCSIQADAAGLWVLYITPPNNARLYHFRDGQWKKRSDQLAIDPRSPFLSSHHRGGVWTMSVGENENGLNRFHDDQITRYALPPELSREFVLCLMEDREGSLWFGTESSGLHCWKSKAISAYGARDGLAHDSTWTVCEARDSSVWIGTEEGLSQFKAGRFRNFTQPDGLSKNNVRSVAEDTSGAIWIGTGGGLNVIRDGVLQQQPFPHKLGLNKIRVVYPARNGELWVGTVDGLFRFQDGAWTTFRTTNGLANADVRALREDKAGCLWIGTFGGGLQSYRDGTFTTFTTTNGLSNNFVWAFNEDADGVLWIGTESGLNRFKDGRFNAFTTREGLPVNLVNEILEDDFGNLWVSHDHGIYRVRKQELNEVAAGRAKQVQTVSYDEADGLPSNETNGQKSYPAGCKTRDGRLWFPTPNGVAVIDPKLCDLDEVRPLAVVEQVRADGEAIFGTTVAAPVTAWTDSTKSPPPDEKSALSRARLRLSPGSGSVLEFRYGAPIFTAPEKTRFRYRLRGAGEAWIEAGKRREAYFTRLRPGNYDFEVMAVNHRGIWSEKSAGFAFHIQPFYYQTWWFYVGCGLVTTGLIAGLVFWRIRELRKMHRLEQQSAIIEERTRIAKDLHDGLGADLTRLALLADLAGGEGSASAGGNQQKLSQSSREAARTLKEMIWIANPANDTVEGLVSRIAQTAEDFLGDACIRCRLDLAPQLPQRTLSLDQRRNLLLVAREALNNIIKHAAATEVCIRAHDNGHSFRLAIEDNGRGFDPASARSDGLGLASMRRRVENSGGTFEMMTHQGVGTKILITLNLGQAGDDSTGN